MLFSSCFYFTGKLAMHKFPVNNNNKNNNNTKGEEFTRKFIEEVSESS